MIFVVANSSSHTRLKNILRTMIVTSYVSNKIPTTVCTPTFTNKKEKLRKRLTDSHIPPQHHVDCNVTWDLK